MMGENHMNKILTATFDSEDNLKAAEKDLLTATIAGFPREKIHVDKEKKVIKVIIPATTKAEVLKMLNDHHPRDVTEKDWKE
jgi:hypothetical protein